MFVKNERGAVDFGDKRLKENTLVQATDIKLLLDKLVDYHFANVQCKIAQSDAHRWCITVA